MIFDYAQTPAADIYKLMSQSVIPRPIAWVVTEQNGVVNVAPFSYFTGLSSKELKAEQSEAQRFNIPLVRDIEEHPPRVEGIPVAFYCDFFEEIDLGAGKTVPLIVRIRHQYVDDAIFTDPERLAVDFDPLARIGKHYALLGTVLTPPSIPE